VFKDGVVYNSSTFTEIRERAEKTLAPVLAF